MLELSDDEEDDESDDLEDGVSSPSLSKLMGHPNQQGVLEEAPTRASVTQPFVQVFRIARPMDGAMVLTAWTVSCRDLLSFSVVVRINGTSVCE